jgi:branched-chain amino acid transport system substrate-binding protein
MHTTGTASLARAAVSLLALAAAAGLTATPAAADDTVVKVGVILTYSGPVATTGDQIDKGLQLYFDQHEKDLPPGVKIELIKRDDTGPNPEVAKRLAQELVTRDHVQFLAGVVWSPNAAAIAPVATEAKVPFVIMNAAGAGITRASPYIIRDSFTLWQESLPIGSWAAKQGWKKAYTAVSDYAPGHDAEAAFAKGFKDGGGEVIGQVEFPLKSPDFVPFFQRAKDAHPDVLFVFVPSGPQATAAMKAYSDLGLKDAGIKLVSTQDLLPDYEIPNMGDAPVGLVSAGTYSSFATRPQNVAFVAAWKKAYPNAIPDFMAVGGYDGMAAIFDVVEKTKGKFDGDEAMKILSNFKDPDSPRGPISINPATRDVIENVYIRLADKKDGKIVNTEFETIPDVKDPWKELNPPK